MKFKHLLSIFLVFVLCFGVCSFALADENTEVPEGYTPIYTAEDLYNIRNDLDGKFILMNDIDLSVYENWEPIGSSETPFTGELDGNGFIIKNMTIISECESEEINLGLFAVASDSFLKNIITENVMISVNGSSKTAFVNVGTVSGKIIVKNDLMRLLKCSATGSINVNDAMCVSVGGLAGRAVGDVFIGSSSSYVDINIVTDKNTERVFVSGILGTPEAENFAYTQSQINIVNSANLGDISIDNSNCSENIQVYLSGILSYQTSGNKVSKCYNAGEISSTTSAGELIVGGIVGMVVSRLEHSCNFGEINIFSNENDKIASICTIEDRGGLAVAPNMPQDFRAYVCYSVNSAYPLCYQDSDKIYTFYKEIYSVEKDELNNQSKFSELNFNETWKMADAEYPVLINQPQFQVNKSISLNVGESYMIKQTDTHKVINGNENVLVESDDNNGLIITALAEDVATIVAEYKYGYSVKYTITVEKSDNTEPPDLPSDTLPTEPTDDECPISNLWIVKTIKWLFVSIWINIRYVISLF